MPTLPRWQCLHNRECSIFFEKFLQEVASGGFFFRTPSLPLASRLSHRMSHYALRGQIMAYCNSLRVLLDDFPTIRDTFFMVGQPNEKKGLKDSSGEFKADPRYARLLKLVVLLPRPTLSQESIRYRNS